MRSDSLHLNVFFLQLSSSPFSFAFTSPLRQQAGQANAEPAEAEVAGNEAAVEDAAAEQAAPDPKDRTRKIPLETSMHYLKSEC